MEQTELKVVNALLKVIGESSVNEVDLSNPDVRAAIDTWDEYSSEIQSNGWWYNIETWALQAQTDGRVVLPPETITIDGSNQMYVKKGRYLYDMENHTYDFSEASDDDLTLNLMTEWDLDEIPPVMFNYILAKAKLTILVDLAYDANKESKLEAETQLRFYLVQKQQLRFGKPNRTATTAASKLLSKMPQLV